MTRLSGSDFRGYAQGRALEHHAIETTGLDETEVCRRVSEGLAGGAFRLDWALVPPMLSEADDG